MTTSKKGKVFDLNATMDTLRARIKARGANGIFGLGRLFRVSHS